MSGGILQTIGVEVEGAARTQDEISSAVERDRELAGLISSVTHDASVESVCMSTGGSRIYLGSSLARRTVLANRSDRRVAGFEVVSVPMSRENVARFSVRLLNLLVRSGEIFSPRSSVHIHVGFPKAHVFARSIIAVGTHMEPLLYKIAGMGRPYRGAINDSAFARSFKTPPIIKVVEGGFVKISPEAAMRAEDERSFWGALAVRLVDIQRYHPARYFGINVLSPLLRGTVEFRHFNYTERPEYIVAVAELAQAIAELMIKMPPEVAQELPTLSLFMSNPDDAYHREVENLLQLLDRYNCVFAPSTEAIETLHKLIETTPQPVFSGNSSLTHLEKFAIPGTLALTQGLERVESAAPCGVINVHNFEMGERSML